MTQSRKRSVLVVGLAGGIAGGKSLVASMMQRRGARVLDADAINHDVLTDPGVVEKVVEHWGSDVLDDRGQVDRTKLARKVFTDDEQVRRLEAIVHPEVCRRISEALEAERADGTAPVVVIDAPLLFEAGLDGMCDRIVYVDAPDEVRLQRTVTGRNWDRKELARRESHQKPLSHKRNRADIVIANDGTTEALRKQVEQLWDELTRLISQ